MLHCLNSSLRRGRVGTAGHDVVRVRPGVVQVARKDSSVRAVVPVHAPDHTQQIVGRPSMFIDLPSCLLILSMPRQGGQARRLDG